MIECFRFLIENHFYFKECVATPGLYPGKDRKNSTKKSNFVFQHQKSKPTMKMIRDGFFVVGKDNSVFKQEILLNHFSVGDERRKKIF